MRFRVSSTFAWGCAGLLFIASSPLFAQTSRDRLERAKIIALQTLERIENGAAPCQKPDCLSVKLSNLEELQRALNRIQWSFEERPQLQAAYQLSRTLRPTLSQEPSSLSEWMGWWRQRYSQTPQQDFFWMSQFDLLVSHRKSIESIVSLIDQDPLTLDRVIEAWNPNFQTAIRSLNEATQKEQLGQRAEFFGQIEQAKLYLAQADQARQRFQDSERAFGQKIIPFVHQLFPDRSRKEALDILVDLDRLSRSFSTTDLLDEEFHDFLRSIHLDWRQVFAQAQRWTDLEYGVVGLKNFDSTVNPAVAHRRELEIQMKLDQIEQVGQGLIDLGQYLFLLSGVAEFSQASKLMSFFGLFSIGYGLEKWDGRMGSRILPTSHRTQEILQQIGTLEERMQRRKESLHEAKATVEKQLSEINRRLEKMKKS